MAEYETLTITELEDLTLQVNTFLEGAGSDGRSGKFTVNQLAAFLAPLIASVGASGYLPTTGTVLPSGTGTAFTFLKGPATYTQSGGANIATTQFLNIASRSGSVWSLTLQIPIDFSLYLKKSDVALNEKNQYVKNLVDITSPAILVNKTTNNLGDIIDFADADLSYRIPVVEGESYYLAGRTDNLGRTLRFEDNSQNKVYYQVINSYPYTIKIPTGLGITNILFPTRLQGFPAYPASITKVIPEISQASVNEVKLLAAGIVDVNSPGTQLNTSINPLGDTVAFTGANVSYPIPVQPESEYDVYSNVTDTYIRGIQFQNDAGTKIGYALVTGMPFSFSTPVNTRYIIFPTKIQSEPQNQIFINRKDLSLPFLGKKVVTYGDSIFNDYPIFRTLLLAKTGASTVIQRGQSGASLGQGLQSNAVLAPAIADAADLYIIHCVNDMRGNGDGSTNIPGSVSSAVGASLDTAGGLKKIITSFIGANRFARIVILSSATYGDVKLIGPGYPNSFGSDQPNLLGFYHADYVKVQKDIADLYGCDFVDFGFKMGIRPSIENNAATRYLTTDGVHWNDTVGFPKAVNIMGDYINGLVI